MARINSIIIIIISLLAQCAYIDTQVYNIGLKYMQRDGQNIKVQHTDIPHNLNIIKWMKTMAIKFALVAKVSNK